MPGQLERLRRLVSPATLALGALCFLLPFCAMSCDAGPLAASGDVVTASGLALATGGDASFNCSYLHQIDSAVQGVVPRIGTSPTPAPTPGTGPCGIGSSSSSTSPSTAAAQKLGPFDGPGGGPSSVHVAVEPLAIVAAALLVLGALVALLRGRAGALGGLVLGAAAAAALVVLRVTLTSAFNGDVKDSVRRTGDSSLLPAFTSIDPSQVFQLTWGFGWWLALVAAAIAAIASFAALAGDGGRRRPPGPGTLSPPWEAPPGAPGAWPSPPGPPGVWPSPPAPPGAWPSPPAPPPGPPLGGGGQERPPPGGWAPPA